MSILSTILTALPIALAISITPGAAFFGIIQTSLEKGFKSGMQFALGIAFSDFLLISLCIWGLANVMQNEIARLVCSIIGGSILIIYGIVSFFNKKPKLGEKHQREVLEKTEKKNHFLSHFAKGFIFNFTNPFIWILWIGITPYSGSVLQYQILFFLTILGTVFSIDCLKSYFAGKIKNAITPNIAYLINRIVGLVFCGLGIFLIAKMLVTIY